MSLEVPRRLLRSRKSDTTRPATAFTPCHSDRSASVSQFVLRRQLAPSVASYRATSASRSANDIAAAHWCGGMQTRARVDGTNEARRNGVVTAASSKVFVDRVFGRLCKYSHLIGRLEQELYAETVAPTVITWLTPRTKSCPLLWRAKDAAKALQPVQAPNTRGRDGRLHAKKQEAC